MDTVTVNVELTDTFGGEANYCWVKRASFKVNANASDAAVIRRAKAELGIGGRHIKESWGEGITLRWPRWNQIAFISYHCGE